MIHYATDSKAPILCGLKRNRARNTSANIRMVTCERCIRSLTRQIRAK